MKIKLALLTAAAVAAVTFGPAQATGFGTYFAVVFANGSVSGSSGVASSKKTAVGKYEITFNLDITGCATVANANATTPAYAVTKRKSGTTEVLQVNTYSKTGALVDTSFNVMILCNS